MGGSEEDWLGGASGDDLVEGFEVGFHFGASFRSAVKGVMNEKERACVGFEGFPINGLLSPGVPASFGESEENRGVEGIGDF